MRIKIQLDRTVHNTECLQALGDYQEILAEKDSGHAHNNLDFFLA